VFEQSGREARSNIWSSGRSRAELKSLFLSLSTAKVTIISLHCPFLLPVIALGSISSGYRSASTSSSPFDSVAEHLEIRRLVV
jgi:hypothetical protein